MENPAAEISPLERDLLRRYHLKHKAIGFPDPTGFVVTGRTDLGSGRVTHLDHEGLVRHGDGMFGLGAYSQFNMPGMEAGASFRVCFEHGKVLYLEILVNGWDHWDGSELNWTVCDPDTGVFKERAA